MRSVRAITGRLLASGKLAYLITIIIVLCATSSGDTVLSNGNYTWIPVVMCPFFFVFYDFKRLMRLGAGRRDYYLGSLLAYAILAVAISILNSLIHLVIDPLYGSRTVINLMDVCGWMDNGIIIAALQQTLFLFLCMVFLYVLLSMQWHWYGWLADVIIIAVICVFTPIAPLRGVLVAFFRLVMLNANALVHVVTCVGVGALIAALGTFGLRRMPL